jgi:hypothetical protein
MKGQRTDNRIGARGLVRPANESFDHLVVVRFQWESAFLEPVPHMY